MKQLPKAGILFWRRLYLIPTIGDTLTKFENRGYQIQLSYLGLDKIKDCKARVQRRVMEGGHDVDAETIKGVFERNLKYNNDFRSTFKVISLYDGMKKPTLLAKILDGQVLLVDPIALKKTLDQNRHAGYRSTSNCFQ